MSAALRHFLAVLLSFSAVIATAASVDAVRFAANPAVVQMRIEVHSNGGTLLYDSGWKEGNLFNWGVEDSFGHLLAYGVKRRYPMLRSLRDSIAAVHDDGGFVVVPHPLSFLTTSAGHRSTDHHQRRPVVPLRRLSESQGHRGDAAECARRPRCGGTHSHRQRHRIPRRIDPAQRGHAEHPQDAAEHSRPGKETESEEPDQRGGNDQSDDQVARRKRDGGRLRGH